MKTHAGLDAAWDAAIQRAGLLRVQDTHELFSAVETLSHMRPLRGERLMIVSNGAAPAALALDALQAVCDAFPNQKVHIDLSELRVDNYHTGLLYAAYGSNLYDAVARGGRYDGLGGYFGRARPAAGFSFDLRSFIGRLPAIGRESVVAVDVKDIPVAQEAVDALREQGQCVVIDYGIGYNGSEEVTGRLKQVDGVWKVIALND